ncbi:lycopene cyclase domain-containing protein [Actinotalea sp. M2MS4P-6]|uniref:lycopene cyclase domain-containing protein n=1 Tax=Actinotalea sp. M2MS4P-6 TaxID=2983762 RepID=UPI0021E4486C|nr:lycopene cyclase domain-containing protein [Actinotalea sp. M2MS4P-6]MCV2393029.1 lycopene cyclase domain-containing protein [Actinotalea sp. M2MS4P-6]
MTYALLAVPFLVAALVVLVVAQRRTGGPSWRVVGGVVGVLLVLTVAFDNVIVGVGLVGYDDDLTLGVRLGVAPVEDLAYAVGAALLLPAVWRLLGARPEVDR